MCYINPLIQRYYSPNCLELKLCKEVTMNFIRSFNYIADNNGLLIFELNFNLYYIFLNMNLFL